MRFALLWGLLLVRLAYVTRTEQAGCALYEDVDEMVCLDRLLITPSLTLSNTSWVVEFYSSWCGHCQHFAPTWKEIVRDTAAWAAVIRVGAIDCASKDNFQKCTEYGIKGFPTIKFYNPGETNPEHCEKEFIGTRSFADVKSAMIQHVEALYPAPAHWPSFSVLSNGLVLNGISQLGVLVFEKDNSSVGKELILDYCGDRSVQVYRVSQHNLSLVKHYSILEFPSIVILLNSDHYQVFSGGSIEVPRSHFKTLITGALNSILSPVATKKMSANNLHSTVASPAARRRVIQGPSRGHITDILGAISYALRREVVLHSIVSGTAYSALLRFVQLLECSFQVDLPKVSLSLGAVREGLESRLSAGFIIRRDWMRILDTKLDPDVFPLDPVWERCNGSQPHLRGFPCGLWMLMHSLTLLTLSVPRARSTDPPFDTYRPSSKEALKASSGFVANFFSCEHCRTHFVEMAQSLSTQPLQHDGDAVLWLWEAHNSVNKRLEGGASTDPEFPKVQFPAKEVCPYCYISGDPGTIAVETPGADSHRIWNRTAVLLFLWNFYSLNHSDVTTASMVLKAAWPEKSSELHIRFYTPSSSNHTGQYDVLVAGSLYSVCFTLILTVAYLLFRRRARHVMRRWTLPK